MKRYFLVSYVFSGGAGDCTVTTDGTMFNRMQFEEQLILKNSNIKELVAISGVYEFKSEDDFKCFTGTELTIKETV